MGNIPCVVAMDMGGTNIKYGVVSDDLRLLSSGAVAADSDSDAETLLCRLAETVKRNKAVIERQGNVFRGVAVSTPGPFDYAAGKSGMRGKYDALYGVDLRKEIRERASLDESTAILFMQDAAAFLLGERVAGVATEETNCSCVTLGTGAGYACMQNGEILLNDKGGPYYVFAFQQYKGERIENLVSGRAIKQRFGVDGKTLFERASAGDDDAVSAFYDIGKTIGEGLCEIPETATIDQLIIGGQVAFSFRFLEQGIKDGLGALGNKITVAMAKHPADAALFGVAYKLFEG